MNSNSSIPTIPSRLDRILNLDRLFANQLISALGDFFSIIQENKLYFFSEYTEHGIDHVQHVLENCDKLIPDDIINSFTPKEIGAIIIAVVLHDIGMQTTMELFHSMLNGCYNYESSNDNIFNDKPWKELWENYLNDCKYWSSQKKDSVFGDPKYIIKKPNLSDPSTNDKKLVGEFIRKHHARIAYEVSIKGYISTKCINGENQIEIISLERIDRELCVIAGIIARSHGVSIRETFNPIKRIFNDTSEIDDSSWKRPCGISIVYLMVLLRLSDYLHIDDDRTSDLKIKLNTFHSDFSLYEHMTHLAIKNILYDPVKEKITVSCNPKNAKVHVKIDQLIKSIQNEFDTSWAILGETYSNEYKLAYRRIIPSFIKFHSNYVPKLFSFRFNSDLSKLLIAPLYGDNPSFGVRELVQNAVDACRLRISIDTKYKAQEKNHIKVSLNTTTNVFKIKDSGIGMTIEEIEKYFLTIGASFNVDVDWKKRRAKNNTYRTGRFGVGVLAAFLLGPEITVKTRSLHESKGYSFKASLLDKYIQIDEIEGMEIGTEIEIICNESIKLLIQDYEKALSSAHSFSDEHHDPLWFNWYIDSIPNVSYYYNDSLITINTFRYLSEFRELYLNAKAKSYGRVFWKPQQIFLEESPSLYCNGFFITNSSNKIEFSSENVKHYYNGLRMPSLIITDYFNKLPLNLQRNNVDSNEKFIFEEQLIEEVLTDQIHQLISLDLSKYNIYHLYICSRGFALKSSYTKNLLDGKHIIHIGYENHFKFKKSKWINLLDRPQFKDMFFSFELVNIKEIESSNGFGHLHKDIDNFTEFALLDKSIIIDNYHKIINLHKSQRHSSSGYCFYNQNNNNYNLIENIAQFIKNQFLNFPIYIWLERIKKTEDINCNQFDHIFTQYFGKNDPVVPYDRELRKKKFPSLFKNSNGT